MTDPAFAPLPDVSGTSLEALMAADPDSALGQTIARLVAQLDDPDGVISAFQNFAS